MRASQRRFNNSSHPSVRGAYFDLGACRSNALCCEKRYAVCDCVILAKSAQRSAETTLPRFLLVFLVADRISFFSRRDHYSDRLLAHKFVDKILLGHRIVSDYEYLLVPFSEAGLQGIGDRKIADTIGATREIGAATRCARTYGEILHGGGLV